MIEKSFEEVVLFARTGLNPRTNFKLGQGTNKYITIKNIHNNSIIVDDNTDVVDDEAISMIHKRSQIKAGDVLFCSIGRMGDMYIIPEEPVGWDINESVFAFTLNTDIIRQKYFYYIFKHQDTLDYLNKNSSGSTFKSIKMNQLKRMVFKLPTLEEQDSMIAVLDSVRFIIDTRQLELQKLDDLINARFVELFGDPIDNPMKWPTKTIKNIATKIGSGATPKGGNAAYINKGISLIRSMHVYNGYFDYEDLAHINEEQARALDNVIVEKNDVLLNITGASVARSCIVPDDILPARVNQHVCIIRCIKGQVTPLFVNAMLINEHYQKRLWQLAEAAGATRQALTKQQIENLNVIVPPCKLQEKFDLFCKQVDKAKAAVQASLNAYQKLFDSLMQQYFG